MSSEPLAPESRVQRWERQGEWPLAAAAGLFLAAYAWPILDTNLSPAWRSTCKIVDYVAWAIFIVDYMVRITIATNRFHYWIRHLHDLAIIALPVLDRCDCSDWSCCFGCLTAPRPTPSGVA